MNLIVLDDDPTIRGAIDLVLGNEHHCLMAESYAKATELMRSQEVDGAIIDIDLKDPAHTGVDFLIEFRKKFPGAPALMQSGLNDVKTVVRCMKLGASDYLEKPFEPDTLRLKIDKIVADSRKISMLSRVAERERARSQIRGTSPALLRAKQNVQNARTMRILFVGETGCGKTPFAYYSNEIVNNLLGKERPVEQINCSALSGDRFIDQVFGHKRGAFTGAVSDKKGLVELAHGGDLFLDEVAEMPLDAQANFLTFLDSMQYYRLGDDKKRTADIRVLSATNKDLKQLVREGKFRQDLYSRLAQVVVTLPPLRERLEDMQCLVEYFIELFAGYQKPYDPKIIEIFKGYRWEEGNVRELRDAVEFLCVYSRDEDRIEVGHIGERYRPFEDHQPCSASSSPSSTSDVSLFDEGLENYLGHIERDLLQKTVREHEGDIDSMASRLKLSRPTLYRRLKKYAIPTRAPAGQ